MTDQELALLRLQQEGALKREEIQAEVRKVVYGSLVVGVAVAFFPVVSTYFENNYNLQIESAKQVNSLALQANQLDLDVIRIERESQLALESAKSLTEQSDREFFENISDEARSAQLSDRITIAEFFSYVAREENERTRWKEFLNYLLEAQEINNDRRSILELTARNEVIPQLERDRAARELAQIDERESGVVLRASLPPWQQIVPVPDALTVGSAGLSPPSDDELISIFGQPHSAPSQECQSPDNPQIIELLETRSVGPFTTTMVVPALDSLERVMQEISTNQPDLYEELGTAGSICVRIIRGSRTVLSNHSWGTAIDITIGGELGPYGAQGVLAGDAELARYFAKEGWVWGGHFSRPDGMHFEVGFDQLKEWEAEGIFGLSEADPPITPTLAPTPDLP